jgi:hypothetical protein
MKQNNFKEKYESIKGWCIVLIIILIVLLIFLYIGISIEFKYNECKEEIEQVKKDLQYCKEDIKIYKGMINESYSIIEELKGGES